MKQKLTRFLSVLLTAAMLAGMPGITALAAPEDADGGFSAEETSISEESNGFSNENEFSVEGSNSVGDMLAEEISQNMLASSGEFYISDLTVSGQTATVTYQALKDSDLVVAIYEEDQHQMLASGTATISAGETTARVTIEGEIPRYFVVAAYLLDGESHEPLCEQFITQVYTRKMQELLDTTVDDYDADQVLNLDNDKNTNFGVFSEDTVQAEQSAAVNVLTDHGNGTYTITNADSTFTSLQPGDTFSYTYADGTVLLVKIAAISVDGTTVTITEEKNTDLSDFFDYMKIETDSYDSEITVDDSALENGISVQAADEQLLEASGEGKKSFSRSYDMNRTFAESSLGSVKLTGKFTYGFTASVKYYLVFTQQYISTVIDYSAAANITLTGKLEKQELPLGSVSCRMLYGTVTLKFTPYFVTEASATITWDGSLQGAVGFAYDSQAGMANLCQPPSTKSKFDIQGELYVGLKFLPEVVVISKELCHVAMTADAGLDAVANRKFPSDTNDFQHGCVLCMEGNLYKKIKVVVDLKLIKGLLKETWTLVDQTKRDKTTKLSDFYYSFDYGEFDWTTCSHITYKVTLTAKDADGNPVAGATVEGTGLDTAPITESNGKAIFYLPNGEYDLTIRKGNAVVKSNVTIDKKKKNITAEFDISSSAFTSKITLTAKDSNNRPVAGAIIEGTGQNTALVTGNDGKAEFYLPNGSYELTISTDDLFASRKITVANMDQDITITLGKIGIIASGTCDSAGYHGEYPRCYWKLDQNGKMTISGDGIVGPVKEVFNGGVWKDICPSVKTVIVGNGITWIEPWSFSHYTNLTKVYISASVEGISDRAFYNSHNLTEAYFSGNLPNIKGWAFELDQDAYLTVHYPTENSTWNEITQGFTIGGRSAIWYPAPPEDIPIIASGTCSGAKSARWKLDENYRLTIYGTGNMDKYKVLFGNPWDSFCRDIKTVIIEDGITGIGQSAFDRCNSLTSISIPDTVSRIDVWAFSNCKNLKSISLPASIKSISVRSFYACSNLTDVYFTGDLPNISGGAFEFGPETILTVHYPANNSTWNEIVKGSTIGGTKATWVPYTPRTIFQSGELPDIDAEESGDTFAPELSEEDLPSEIIEESSVPTPTEEIPLEESPEDSPVPVVPDVVPEEAVPEISTVEPLSFILPAAAASKVIPTQAFSGTVTNGKTKLVKFTGLASGKAYVLLVVKNENAASLLAASNLLYIAQGNADKNGKLSFAYIPRTSEAAAVRAYGPAKKQKNTITAASFTKTTSAKAQSFSIKAKAKGGAKLTYKSNHKSVKVNGSGKVTIAKNFVGKATITITAAATDGYSKTTKKITVTVNPARVKLTTATNTSGGKLKAAWAKNSKASGYQLQYATDSKFKKGAKTVKISGAKNTAKTISGLAKGKKYYVRVRSYKTVSGKTYYSGWSSAKTVTIKK